MFYVYNLTSMFGNGSGDTQLMVFPYKMKNMVHVHSAECTDVTTLVRSFTNEKDAWDFILGIDQFQAAVLQDSKTVLFEHVLCEGLDF